MAMNKSRTSMPMKILIIVLAVAMASSILLGTLFSSLSSQPRVSDTQTGTTTGSSDQIAQQYAATIKANDAALAKSPKEYSILVSQGNTYFDWAQQVQQAPALAAQQQQLPLWTKAAGYYGRAIAATKTFDPQVGTDLSVSYYYGGQADKAITMIERVLKVAPTLTPALLNAGIFYESTNQTATAVAMYTKLIGVKGASADQVKFVEGRLAGLKK